MDSWGCGTLRTMSPQSLWPPNAHTIAELTKGGETLTVEFKTERRGMLSDADLIDAVVCLANGAGPGARWLLLGVDDDGRISGMIPRHGRGTDTNRIAALIANRTVPPIAANVAVVTVDGLDVLAIRVSPASEPVGTSDGRYLRRSMGGLGTPECVPLHFSQVRGTDGSSDYSRRIVPGASWEDLDPLEFERFRRFIRESQGRGDIGLVNLPDIELSKALGAVEANGHVTGIRALGLLLFGKEEALARLIPTHEVAFQVLSGLRVEQNDFFRWPLLRVVEQILTYFRARNREHELVVGLRRVPLPDYSELAFREAIANALIHRDYARIGAVHVKWEPTSLEISNPGGFPEGVTLTNLLVTPPRPRNPLLADVFKRAGLVERAGRGVDTIFYEQVRSGRPPPSYAGSSSTDVVLLMPGGEPNLSFVHRALEQAEAGHPLSLAELLILNRIWYERRLTVEEAALVVQQSISVARSALEGLVEVGLLDAAGSGRSREYHLSATSYRESGNEAGYVRVRGFEPIQQEQMILQWVRSNGSITRGQAAELCRVEPTRARAILARLVTGGKLEIHGQRRAARYVLPENS